MGHAAEWLLPSSSVNQSRKWNSARMSIPRASTETSCNGWLLLLQEVCATSRARLGPHGSDDSRVDERWALMDRWGRVRKKCKGKAKLLTKKDMVFLTKIFLRPLVFLPHLAFLLSVFHSSPGPPWPRFRALCAVWASLLPCPAPWPLHTLYSSHSGSGQALVSAVKLANTMVTVGGPSVNSSV